MMENLGHAKQTYFIDVKLSTSEINISDWYYGVSDSAVQGPKDGELWLGYNHRNQLSRPFPADYMGT